MEQVLYQTIACNIRKRRKQLRYSQAKLAEKADISVDTIKSIESGRRTMNLDTYLKIVEALETTPHIFKYFLLKIQGFLTFSISVNKPMSWIFHCI